MQIEVNQEKLEQILLNGISSCGVVGVEVNTPATGKIGITVSYLAKHLAQSIVEDIPDTLSIPLSSGNRSRRTGMELAKHLSTEMTGDGRKSRSTGNLA